MSKTFIDFSNEFPPIARGVAKVLNESSQILPLLPVVSNAELVHHFKREVSQGGVTSRSLNSTYAETASGKVVPAQEKLGIMGAEVLTDVRMERARADEIARRSQAVGRYFDAQFARGQGSTNPLELVGLKTKITGAQLISAGANGADLTLDLFHQLIDATDDFGGGKIVWMNRTMFREFKSLVIAGAGAATVADLTGTVMEYEDVKILTSKKDHVGDEILPFTETQGSYTTATSIYCFAPGPTSSENSGVQTIMATNSIEVYDKGIVGAQYADLIELCAGFAIFQDKAAARLAGVKLPT